MNLPNQFSLQTGSLEELNEIISRPGFKGTISNLPADVYHQCIGVSRSSINELHKSVSHYVELKNNPKAPNRDMIFGSAFHDYIMLPESFQSNYAFYPSRDIEGLLDTSDDLKSHLSKFIDTKELRRELGLNEAKIIELENALPSSTAELDDQLAQLKPEEFATKKDFAAKQKEIKDQIKEIVSAKKEEINLLKAKIKSIKENINEKESFAKGTKEELIAKIRTVDTTTPIWDEIIKRFESENEGKQILGQDELNRIMQMGAKVKSHPTLSALLNNKNNVVLIEQSFFWTDDLGILRKCRPDILIISPQMVLPLDYKTTDDASVDAFQRSIAKFLYHFQAPYYIDGISEVLDRKVENFLFVPVEKKAPFEIALYALNEKAIDIGRKGVNELLLKLKHYQEKMSTNKDVWLGYPVEVQDITIPRWAFPLEAQE